MQFKKLDAHKQIRLMPGQNQTFKGLDGNFNFIDWGGNGPTAHFSHATGLCAGAYTPLAQKLRSRLKMVGMDDRGHGKTRAPADPKIIHNWDVFVDDLAAFCEHLDDPVIAIGHSRGGTVSLLLAIKRPELIRALVMIDPTILPFSWKWPWYLAKKTGAARLVPIVATAAKRKNIWPNRQSILDSYRNKAVFRSWQKGFLKAYIEAGTEETEDGKIRLCCAPDWESRCFAVCPHDLWTYIPALKVPTLVLFGTKSDTFLTSTARRLKAKVPLASMVRLEETGHFVPMDRPDETVEIILNFLKKQTII
jgi:pimeloyl-ACP methyl ester carboxylesterase